MRGIFLISFLFPVAISAHAQQVRVVNLRCENRTAPMGIDMGNPAFGWQMQATQRAFMQSAYHLQVSTDSLQLVKGHAVEWNTGKITSSQSQFVRYAGKKLRPAQKYFWRIRIWDKHNTPSSWSEVSSFTTALFENADWSGAKWIGFEELPDSSVVVPGVHQPDAKKLGNRLKQRAIVPLFRKEFSVRKKVVSALAFVSGLGQYEMYCNGEKTGNSFLAPGWTMYDKRWLYNTYDITRQLKNGANAIGIIVGNGFHYINRERYYKLALAFGFPKMICKIQIRYEDGSKEEIISDTSWKTAPSPISYSSLFGGEDYDARAEQPGWAQSSFDDRQWKSALLVKAPKGKAESEKTYPVMVNNVFRPKNISQPSPGIYVYDFGQNASGIVELKVKGRKGQTIRLTPAELLNDKNLANQNATGKPFYFSYTLKGDGVETWSPRFTYYGFRYVQVECLASPLPASPGGGGVARVADTFAVLTNGARNDGLLHFSSPTGGGWEGALTLLHTSNSAPPSGSFHCSNPLFNKINNLIRWAIKSNMQSVVTDCPHREKLSWLEQDYLMGGSILYNFDTYHLYKKLVYDMMDAQTPEGLVPDIAPEYVFFDDNGFGFRDSPEWGSACIAVPWMLYQWYGDKEIVRTAYPMMKKYVAYLESRAKDHILSYGLGDWYDLGPNRPGVSQLTPNGLTATAIYYYDITLLQKAATLLKDRKESERYYNLAAEVKKAFNEKFFDTTSKVYATGSQTAMAMPLAVRLVELEYGEAVWKNLVDSITASGKQLTAGDIGYHFLVKALMEGGASQLLYDMNYRDDVPGYGFQLKKGATALTESWAALREVSNNHLMLGHIMEWFYSGLAGINQSGDSMGFKELFIFPQVVKGIKNVSASYETLYGTVKSDWVDTDTNFVLMVSVPENTSAYVLLPATPKDDITIDGKEISKSKGVSAYHYRFGLQYIKVGSGNYVFEIKKRSDLVQLFQNPPESAKPWVFWYWMQAAVSKEGITADLEAMKEAGIGGAYLMPIKGKTDPPLYNPPAEQLTPLWWQMVKHAMQEADRLKLKLAMHVSDGFALAGGPWITPELSMQKIVWTKTYTKGETRFNDTLAKPQMNEGYYRDIAVYALPVSSSTLFSTNTTIPKITTSTGTDANFLATKNSRESFRCDTPCWVQYEFDQPITARSLMVRTNGNNYQSHRLRISSSDDGKTFRAVGQLEAPRHGWQDTDANVTHSIPATTARFFRFMYDRAGSEPGAEDLDAAKWRQSLKLAGIELSGAPVIHQYEGKSGAVWRVSPRTTQQQVPDSMCVRVDKIIDITSKMSADGKLNWEVPPGNWLILRMGHTSTGHTNATGGGGKGLECDKFNAQAVKLQFNNWFGEVYKQVGDDLAKRALKMLHVDSWECGSQNWSPVFREEFKKRRGYDPLKYLPAMAGIPLQDAEQSEKFLYDVRQTIAELVKDVFYGTLAEEAKEKDVAFSAESVAPTMTSDGMLHYSQVDLPMGEFWHNSPTHDKPNDMLDAISGAHVYGKQIVQAEAFTTLRMNWGEHPGNLKTLGDRNYALGINRLVYHVFTQNPWTDRRPGMTLDGIGLYFQRDQTWWKPGKAWVEYAQRCQALLQFGKPVVDIAVFTGEEIPRRSVLPDRLVNTLPGIIGRRRVQMAKEKLTNTGEPLRELPDGVTHSANMADPEDWIDPLRGYAYDSFNPDALQLAGVKKGKIELPGGASYGLLVLPEADRLLPEIKLSKKTADKIDSLEKAGAKIIRGRYPYESFNSLGVERDFLAFADGMKLAEGIAWTHRQSEDVDIYFISNQLDSEQVLTLFLRIDGKAPEIWDPVTGEILPATNWLVSERRTQLPIRLAPNASLFVVFRQDATPPATAQGINWRELISIDTLNDLWSVTFDSTLGGPKHSVLFSRLQDWSTHEDSAIRYYSGTATYTQKFNYKKSNDRVWLDVGEVANLASVYVNGVACGVAWTAPYQVEITAALQDGENDLRIEVTNTWANRLIGDQFLPADKRITWTTAPFRLKGKPLLKAGLLGPVVLKTASSSSAVSRR